MIQAKSIASTLSIFSNNYHSVPKHGKMDEHHEGMEDDATEDPDGCVWEKESDVADNAAAEDGGSDEKPHVSDPNDWVDAGAAREEYKPAHAEVPHHCHGGSELATCGSQSSLLLGYQSRLRTFQDVQTSITSIRNPVAQSLGNTVGMVIKAERKHFATLCRSTPEVSIVMQQKNLADAQHKGILNQ